MPLPLILGIGAAVKLRGREKKGAQGAGETGVGAGRTWRPHGF